MSRHASASAFHKSKTLNDKYLLGDEIGKGAYGRVYKGLDLENGDFVAIKQVSLENIPSEDLASIMSEIDLLKNLNHKNIVKYQGSFKTKTHLYIILEYVENGSLASIIKPSKFGAFPESLVAVYIAQVLEGLVYLHEQGVIHRDIKGANILTTKEGLVKLADFGVATKLTEADINTHSVVGTPYWMAPEVIEMSGVSAASDIWSVGCTVIELLTCIPPYYDLQPMPALFRIVQDERPPLPEHVSGVITDFLLQCFRKDAKLRPDAKTLLNHPWIRNSRRQLQSSLERNARISNIPEDVSIVLERTIQEGSKQNPPAGQEEGLMRDPFESGSDDDAKGNSPTTSYEASAASSSQSHSNGHGAPIRIPRQGVSHFQRLSGSQQLETTGTNSSGQNRVTSLAIGGHVLAQVESPDSVSSRPETGIVLDLATGPGAAEDQLRHETSGRWSDHGGGLSSGKSQIGISHGGDDGEVKDLMMGEKKHNLVSRTEVNVSLFPQGAKTSSGAADKVSRFKEPPSDALMDDLFESSHVRPQDASTSAPSDHGLPPRGGPVSDTASAGKLKSKVPQKKILNADGSKRSSVDLFTALIDVDEKEIDISELGFENRAEGRDYFAKQASEVNRLMGLLKPEEQDEVVISACQKLVLILREFPNRKSHLISHHGLIPLMDMLETNSNKVLHEIMRVINQVIQDNQDLQENACLVGLVPAITSFAGQERSREIRRQAAYFVQQLCHTSPLTLQMFIACRGLPVLVGFLEPDYAKFREMVHMAVDGMWQVFELHSSSPKNDFCRIFAKSGVLVRLVNTLHNLNEAMRAGAVIAVSSTSTTTGDKPAHKSTGSFEGLSVKARSGPLDHVKGGHIEAFRPYSGQLEPSKVARSTHTENYRSSAGMEAARLQPGHAHKSTGLPDYSRHFPGQAGQQGRPHSGQLDPARVAHSSEHVRQPTAVDLFLQYGESTNWQPDAGRVERDEEVRSDGDSTRPLLSADESWALLEAVPQTGHAPVDLPLQASFLNLLDKEKPPRPITGQQLDNVRHPSDRSESTLPLLHHSGVLRRSGDFDSGFPASTDGEKETGLVEMVSLPLAKLGWNGRLSPSPSGRLNIQGSWPLANVSEPYSNGSGLASQTASGVLTASGHPNTRLGSTTSSGVLTRMQSALNPEEAREYITKVSNLLLEFSRGDSVVKMHMCSLSLLIRLFQMLNKLETPILLKILKCINQLSTEPNTLEPLQRADAMKHLVPFLEQREGPYVADIQNEVLSALHNLCKINKRRQEQAAESGIIPHLMHFIVTNSPLKQYALPLLCDMAHASRYTREQLRVYKGLDVYLSLLDDQMWAVTALDSLAVCLAHDNDQRKVESALLKKEALMKLVGFFQSCGGNSFVHILEPFLKMINKSVRLNTALAVSGLTPLLVGRLDHQDAIARLNLLKMIKAVYEHHPRPKQLIVEHDLPSKLQKLIEERRDGERSGGQVLVKQMATALLKALHINTVL